MKKFNSGGSVDADLLDQQMNSSLKKFNLKSKDERKVRDALMKLSGYMNDPEGKSFSVSQTDRKYTVSGEGAEQFTGSADEVRSNWLTGSLKIKDDKDVMSVAAAVYDDAIRNLKPSSTSQETAKSTAPVRIKELSDYVINDFYGTSGNYGNKRLSWKNDDEIKEHTMLAGASLANSYLRNPIEGNDSDEAKEYISWIQAAKDAADKKDWASFEQVSHKLGWDYSRLFLTQDEQNAIKAKDEAAKAEDETAAAERALNSYNSAGLSDVVKKALFEGGFTEQVDSWAEGHENNWLKLLSQKQGATTWKNPTTGKFVSYDKEGKIWSGADENRFSPAFGFSWGWDNTNKTMRLYKPSELKLNTGLGEIEDPYKDLTYKEGVELEHNWNNTRLFGYGSPEGDGVAKDIYGRNDILSRILAHQGSSRFWLTRGTDGKYYNDQGKLYDIKLSGLKDSYDNYYSPEELFTSIDFATHGKKTYDYNKHFQNALNTVKSHATKQGDGSYRFNAIGQSGLEKSAVILTKFLQDYRVRGNQELTKEIYKLLEAFNKAKQSTQSAKLGAKLKKLQPGGTLPAYVLAARKNVKSPEETPLKPVKNLSGAWNGMSTAEKWLTGIETVGDAVGIIPGFGVIGAVASGLAGGVRDAIDGDGKVNWGKHAMNLGFIGASFAGAGAAKWLAKGAGATTKAVKATKAAKVVDAAVDTTKTVDKAAETALNINKLSKSKNIEALKLSGVDDVVKSVEKIKNSTEITDLSKVTKEIAKKAGVLNEFTTILKASEKTKLGSVVGNITKDATKASYKWIKDSNIVRKAGTASQVILPGMALVQAPGVIRDIKNEGWDNVNVDRMQGVLIGGASGWHGYRNLRNYKLMKSIGMSQKAAPSSKELKVDFTDEAGKLQSKTFDITKFDPKGKFKTPLFKGKDFRAKVTEQIRNVEGTKNITDDNIKAALDGLSAKDFKNHFKKGEWQMDFDPNVVKGGNTPFNRWKHKHLKKALKDFEWTNPKVETTVNTKPALNPKSKRTSKSPNKNRKPVSKKLLGGLILKASTGTSVEKVYDTKKQYQFNNNNPIYLPHSNVVNDGSDWRFGKDGKYTLGYSRAIESLDDNWWNANKTKIQDLTVGTNVKINDLPTFKKLATDYKPGRIHEFTFNKQNLGIPEKLKNTYSTDYIAPTVDKLSPGPINPNASVGNTGRKGIGAGISQEKGIFQGGDKAVLDNLPNLVSNIMSYGINQAGATKAYGHLRKSLIDSMYQLPYQKHQYFRTSTPYTLLTEQAAGNYSSQVNRIASTMADIDKATGARLQGAAQVEEMRTKGRVSDFEYNEKIRNAQDQSNLQIDSANTETLAKNRQLVSDTLSKLGQLNYNEQMLKTHNLNNLNLGVYQWLKNTKDAKNRSSLFEAYSNPEYLKLTTAYNDHQAKKPDLLKTIENEWKSKHKDKIWDESYAKSDTRYKDWETENTRYESILKPINNNYNMMKVATQMNIPYSYYSDKLNPWYFKKGGNLAPGEYLEAVRLQSESKIKVKEIEMFYKMIMHNNAMLQKSLIKVFK